MPDFGTQVPDEGFKEPLYNVAQSTSKEQDMIAHNSAEQSKLTYEDISSESTVSLDQEVSKYNQIVDSHEFQFYPGTEREFYEKDFIRHGLNKTNMIQSITHVLKGTLGAGVLSMHEVFMIGGLWTSLCTIICIGMINFYAMYILGRTAQLMYSRTRMTKLSYPDLAEMAAATGPWRGLRKFSKVFRYTVDVCLVSCMGGTCCIYQIIIAETFKFVFENCNIDLSPWLGNNIRLYLMVIMPVLMCICVIRSLRILAPFSMVCDVLIALCVITALYFSLLTGAQIADRPAWKDTRSFIRVIALCVYSTCGIGICLPVENNMRRPRLYPVMIAYAMSFTTLLTATTGFFGYWGWGESCRSPITVNMPAKTFTTILHILMGLMLCVTFSVQFWVPFRIFWYYTTRKHRQFARSRKTMCLLEKLYRLLMVFIVTCVAVAFPNLIPFMAFIGHFFLGFIGFIFPAAIESLVTWKDDRRKNIRWRLVKNIFMMAFGVFLSITAVQYTWKF